LGAATLGTDVEDFVSWLVRTGALKPGVHMPTFDMLDGEERRALASYLHGLR
ncbi:MAG: cytochrome B, partial [Polyangiaceae bacterium]|nr:cytochrome B [Polyangiaceae bacterium]